MRIRLDYFDQNDDFASCLPRTGRVVARLSATGGVTDWHLVLLDQAISYRIGFPEPPPHRFIETHWVLIRSRWQGRPIGEAEPVSVFLLLVQASQLPLPGPIDVQNYYHAAWAMCHTLPPAT